MYIIYYVRITDAICLSFYFKHLENLILSVFQSLFNFLCGFLHLNGFIEIINNA